MNVTETTTDGTRFSGELTDTMLDIANAGFSVEDSSFTFVSFTKGELKWEVPGFVKKAIRAGKRTIEDFGKSHMESRLGALEVYQYPDGHFSVIDGEAGAAAEREAAYR